jgi:alanine racemase
LKELTRPAWLEINLNDLACNYNQIRKALNKGTDLMAIIKADAYENGAIQIANELMKQGVDKFGVATLSEALHIRKSIEGAKILIMGYTPDYLMKKAIEEDIDITVYMVEQAKLASELAKKLNKDALIHIKIETGMNRLGFMPTEESIMAIQKIYSMNNIKIEGIFTHFAASDNDPSYTFNQAKKFDYIVDGLKKLGLRIPLRHVSNSAAIMRYRELDYDMVRAGIILYGVYTSPDEDRDTVHLTNILSLKAQISNVKEIEKGEKISYGLTYETLRKSKIATVPIGYADGYSRSLSNKGSVIVKNTIVPVVGRICMDQLMIDVTELDVKVGDEVVLMGKSGDKEITIEEIAMKIGGIPAEVFCMMNKRLPRVYIKDGKVEEVVDYLLEI